MDEQQWRWVGDLPQQRRIAQIIQRQQVTAGLLQPSQILLDPSPVRGAQIVERRGGQIQPDPFSAASGERLGGGTEMFQQPGESRWPDARRSQQCQQPGGIVSRGGVVQGVVTRSCRRMARSACITSA